MIKNGGIKMDDKEVWDIEFDLEEYEKKCEEIRKENEKFLEIFENDLQAAGLKPRTISRHVNNVGFYLNEFLLYEDANPMPAGCLEIDNYLGYFFIRKCMWSTPATIKSTAASIKKFYKSMVDHGKLEREDYAYLCETIKARMEDWQADCEQFNDPYAENPFAFF